MVTKDEMRAMTMNDLVKEHQAMIKRWRNEWRFWRLERPMQSCVVIHYLEDIGEELGNRLEARKNIASYQDLEDLRTKVDGYDFED